MRAELRHVQEGESAKQKSYTALCWLPVEVTDAVLATLTSEQELVLTQTTPTRVAHRCSLSLAPSCACSTLYGSNSPAQADMSSFRTAAHGTGY